jgi:hypothetical protein
VSRKNNPLSKQASLSLIAADTKFFRDFALDPHPDYFRSVAGLVLMPFLSAFANESVKYFERTDPIAGKVLQSNQDMLLWSRMRTKLTEDKYRTSAAVLENVEELIAINSGWFLKSHRGIRRPLRLIQPDVGLTFMNNEMFYTTHVAFLNLGLTKEALSNSSLNMDTIGPFLYDRAVPIGQYIELLARKLDVGAYAPAVSPVPPSPQEPDRDMKSNRLYKSMAQRVAPGQRRIGILLSWILSQINTARIIVPLIARENEITALKIRFVSLYQTALSLQKLLNEEPEASFLLPSASELIAETLKAQSVSSVLQAQGLRNDLVHYGVRKRMSQQLSTKLPLFGLVEAHTGGRSLENVSTDVDQGLERVYGMLRVLLPPNLISRN